MAAAGGCPGGEWMRRPGPGARGAVRELGAFVCAAPTAGRLRSGRRSDAARAGEAGAAAARQGRLDLVEKVSAGSEKPGAVMLADGWCGVAEGVQDPHGVRLGGEGADLAGVGPAELGGLRAGAQLAGYGPAAEDQRDDAAGHVLVD